jgi:hypothetical protein
LSQHRFRAMIKSLQLELQKNPSSKCKIRIANLELDR